MLSKDYAIKATTTVLGEALKVCSEKNKHDCLESLRAHLQKGNKITIHEPDLDELGRFSESLSIVKKRLWGVDSMDIRVLAEALADRTSRGLLTFDNKFVNNTGWSKLRQEAIWRKGFTVSDYVEP